MKNACLLLYDGINFDSGGFAFLQELTRAGYAVEETRVLSTKSPDTFKAALIDLKNGYDNLFLVCQPTEIPFLKSSIEEVFSREYFQGEGQGMGIYSEGEKSWFLLVSSAEGQRFLKGVCLPFLDRKYASAFAKCTLRLVGADGGKVEALIRWAEQFSEGKLRVLRTHRYGEDCIELLYDQTAPKMLIDEVMRRFVETLGESLYALDDTPLEEQLVNLLKLRGKKIAVAESFTGGGVGRRIVSVSGASKVFVEGLNTYSEVSKMKRLGVSEYTLRSYGAVSKETAYEMAAGLLRAGDAQISIATTGLAGPESDGSGLPVGVCCIAVGVEDKVFVSRYKLDGDRTEITETAINYALFLACKQLKNL